MCERSEKMRIFVRRSKQKTKMKKYLALTAALLCALTSCVRREAVRELAGQRDSLTVVVAEKD